MKVDKIQKDMLTAYFKDKAGFKIDYHYGEDDYNVYVIYKGVVAYKLPKDMFMLDIPKMKINEFKGIKVLFDCTSDAEELTYAYDKEISGKMAAVYMLDGVGFGINRRLLKTFEENKHELTLKGTAYNKPVYVYDYDVCIGLIMPINLKK